MAIALATVPQDDVTDEEVLQKRQEAFEGYLQWIQSPREFKVKTLHLLGDHITLEGVSLGFYKDTYTLTAGDGEYEENWILVEEQP